MGETYPAHNDAGEVLGSLATVTQNAAALTLGGTAPDAFTLALGEGEF
jgi:hypothetical protein